LCLRRRYRRLFCVVASLVFFCFSALRTAEVSSGMLSERPDFFVYEVL